MKSDIEIRIATEEDAEELLELYRPYVTETAITFEYEVPSVEEFKRRITHVKEKFPYLIAQRGKRIAGYAYVSPFKGRPAYDWSVETSIYVGMNEKRQGIGKKLYEEMEHILKEQGILNMNACIADPRQEDAHLTKDSILFHEKLGYKMVGKFHNSGYKFNTWYDMVWMEKEIGKHIVNQPKVVWWPEYEKNGGVK